MGAPAIAASAVDVARTLDSGNNVLQVVSGVYDLYGPPALCVVVVWRDMGRSWACRPLVRSVFAVGWLRTAFNEDLVSTASKLAPTDSPIRASVRVTGGVHAELAQAHRAIAQLRNPAGAIRLAVQILAGPLRQALAQIEPGQHAQVLSVLEALESSTTELCAALGAAPVPEPHSLLPQQAEPAANDDVSPSHAQPNTVAVAVPSGGPSLAAAVPTPQQPVPGVPWQDADDLLARLEVLVVTRSPLPALLSVDVAADLCPMVSGSDLLQALCGLVDNAIEASARAKPRAQPWTVEVRAFLASAEDRSGGMHVVFEVRDHGDGLPEAVTGWLAQNTDELEASDQGPGAGLRLARRVADDAGGRLEACRKSRRTCVRIRVPQYTDTA